MPKSPSASHLMTGPSAGAALNNNYNNVNNNNGNAVTSSNLSSGVLQQLGGPNSVGATSLMNLPKVNASPSSHFHDRLQRSGAPPPLPPSGAEIVVGTPGGRALPIPPGQSQPPGPASASLPPIAVGGPTSQGVGVGGGVGGGGPPLFQGDGLQSSAPTARNLPPTPHAGALPSSLPQQQTAVNNSYNQSLPQINGTLPNGLGTTPVRVGGLPSDGGMLQKGALLPQTGQQQQQPPATHQHPFGTSSQLPQHHQNTMNPPLTLPSTLQQQQQQQPNRDSLLLNNRSDSDSDTEWC